VIPGYFNAGSGWPVPWVRAFLYVPDLSPVAATVEFIVDTGCERTVLHPLDATQSFSVDPAALVRPDFRAASNSAFGVGGGTRTFPLPARYGFVDDAGSLVVVDGEILVAQMTTANQGLPSLLGWDVLDGFSLTTNRRAGIVSLERLDT
jgi:hypothetical protein